MKNLALTFVIVCRCGSVFEGSTIDVAEMEYGDHIRGSGTMDTPNPTVKMSWTGSACPIKTEAWRGWSIRDTP